MELHVRNNFSTDFQCLISICSSTKNADVRNLFKLIGRLREGQGGFADRYVKKAAEEAETSADEDDGEPATDSEDESSQCEGEKEDGKHDKLCKPDEKKDSKADKLCKPDEKKDSKADKLCKPDEKIDSKADKLCKPDVKKDDKGDKLCKPDTTSGKPVLEAENASDIEIVEVKIKPPSEDKRDQLRKHLLALKSQIEKLKGNFAALKSIDYTI